MAVTIRKIARELKISQTAVSFCLNDKPGVSDELRRQVKSLANSLGYRSFRQGRGNAGTGVGTRKIAVLYPVGSSELFQAIQNGIDPILRKKGFHQLRFTVNPEDLVNDETKETYILDLVENENISGLVVVLFSLSDSLIARLRKKGVPAVLIDHYTDAGSCVVFDNFNPAHDLTTRLIRSGRKNIGCIMALNVNNRSFEERFNGYKQALLDSKIKYRPELVGYEYSFMLTRSAYATWKLVKENPEIDALLFGSDIQAVGGIKALQEMDRKIPGDIAVIGFDDTEMGRLMVPALSSVKIPWYHAGVAGAEMLVQAIEKPGSKPRKINLKSELILRGSFSADYPDPKWIEQK